MRGQRKLGRKPRLLQRSLHFLKLFLGNLSSGKPKLQDLKRVLWRSWRSLLIGRNRGCSGATRSPDILLNDPGNVIRLTFQDLVQDQVLAHESSLGGDGGKHDSLIDFQVGYVFISIIFDLLAESQG